MALLCAHKYVAGTAQEHPITIGVCLLDCGSSFCNKQYAIACAVMPLTGRPASVTTVRQLPVSTMHIVSTSSAAAQEKVLVGLVADIVASMKPLRYALH